MYCPIFLLSFQSLILVSIFSIHLYSYLWKTLHDLPFSNSMYVFLLSFQSLSLVSIFTIHLYSYLSETLHDLPFINSIMLIFLQTCRISYWWYSRGQKLYNSLHCIYFHCILCCPSILGRLIDWRSQYKILLINFHPVKGVEIERGH